MAINDDLNSLLNNTRTFLENNALLIHGAADPSANHTFVLQATGQEGWKSAVGGVRDIPRFICYPSESPMDFGVGPRSTPPFAAVSVSMRSFNSVTRTYEDSATTHHVLPVDAPAVMVTTMLSGCTFGIGSNAGGARLVSHVQPPEGRRDNQARLLLDQTIRAGFPGGRPNVSVMSSLEQRGTVVGIRTGDAWTFYAQQFSYGGGGVVNSVQVYH